MHLCTYYFIETFVSSNIYLGALYHTQRAKHANLTTPIKPDHPLLTEILRGGFSPKALWVPPAMLNYTCSVFMNSTKHIQESEFLYMNSVALTSLLLDKITAIIHVGSSYSNKVLTHVRFRKIMVILHYA